MRDRPTCFTPPARLRCAASAIFYALLESFILRAQQNRTANSFKAQPSRDGQDEQDKSRRSRDEFQISNLKFSISYSSCSSCPSLLISFFCTACIFAFAILRHRVNDAVLRDRRAPQLCDAAPVAHDQNTRTSFDQLFQF